MNLLSLPNPESAIATNNDRSGDQHTDVHDFLTGTVTRSHTSPSFEIITLSNEGLKPVP